MRVLIVGGGCRGLDLARELVAEGHAARCVTRTEDGRAAIEAAGGECWIGTPDVIGTLRYALENSLNMPALYIADRVGLSALRRTLTSFRLAESVQQVPSLALGALDTNLLRLTAAYGALANSGIYIHLLVNLILF